ncbi:hypothetical protein EVAR_42984_1 [Eumeta japonica]|uniref:Uncharacterized protein n=1 Tax=Eumeta variegata TaxID=151549 RepID=A0A4C1WDL4_EUMVA|nr:hypothetical protein EVAR_42984_1 [Eumeta japonica]
MEVDTNPNKEPAKRPSESRLSEELISDSWSDDSNDLKDSDKEGFAYVQKQKSLSFSATPAAPTAAATTSVKAPPSTPFWRTVRKSLSQDAPASQKTKASKTAKLSQTTKAVNSKVPTATTVAIDEADVIEPPPLKHFTDHHLYSSMMRAAGQKFKNNAKPKALIYLPFSRHLKFYITHTPYKPPNLRSSVEEREFHVFLRGVPKELPLKEVKEDLLAQDLPVQSVRRFTNRA